MAITNGNVDFVVDFSPHKEFKMFSGGGGSDAVPFDGLVEVVLQSWSSYESKDKKLPMAKLVLVVQDEDGQGLKLVDDVCCGGKDKNGNDLGRQLMSFLCSSGTLEENIQKNGANGAKATITQILNAKVGKKAWAEIEASSYDGRDNSEVKDYRTEEYYKQAKTVGAHRRKRRTVGQAAGAGAGGMNLGGNTNGAAPGQASTPAGASLPML